MRKRMTSAFVAVTFVLLIGVSVHANDEQIGKQIVGRLQEQRQAAQLEGFNIGVQVENGTVTMSGSVTSAEQAGVALDVARRVPGVKLVVNDLRIQTAAAAATEAPSAAAPATAQPVNYTAAAPPIPQPATVQITAPAAPPAPAPAHVAPAMSMAPPPVPQAASMPAVPPMAMAPTQPMGAPQMQAISAMQQSAIPIRAAAASRQPLAFARGNLKGNRPLPAGPGLMRAQYMEAQGGVVHGGGIHGGGVHGGQMYGGEMSGVPMEGYSGGYAAGMSGGAPMPMATAGMGAMGAMGMPGGTPTYDNPQMPAYAWPSYASYPNYAALTYPHQYSPTAWPYIGPFYPYPQVPLGWRKVMLEWDDGWWQLDFLSK